MILTNVMNLGEKNFNQSKNKWCLKINFQVYSNEIINKKLFLKIITLCIIVSIIFELSLPIVIFVICIAALATIVYAVILEKRRRKRATQGRIVTENRISIDIPSINQARPFRSNSNLFHGPASNLPVYFDSTLTQSIHTLNHLPVYQTSNPIDSNFIEKPMLKQ